MNIKKISVKRQLVRNRNERSMCVNFLIMLPELNTIQLQGKAIQNKNIMLAPGDHIPRSNV